MISTLSSTFRPVSHFWGSYRIKRSWSGNGEVLGLVGRPHSLQLRGCMAWLTCRALQIQCVITASWGTGNFLWRLCHPLDRRIFYKAACVPVHLDVTWHFLFWGIVAFLEVLLGSWAEAPAALEDHRSPSSLPVWGSLFLDSLDF